jgi:metal-responsive CopG/Arc/MetJ family transcriptional regulator
MATYTSTLPDKLLAELDQTAKQLKIPKNKLIEKAISFYLHFKEPLKIQI